MQAVVFPTWARFALGCLVALIGYLVTGGVINIDEDARAAIAALVALLATAGVVPPKPGDLPAMAPWVRFALLIVVIVLTYLVQSVLGLDDVVRGIVQAVILLAASVGITPPQATGPATR